MKPKLEISWGRGIIPPHNTDIEHSLLACCLVDPDAIERVVPIVGNGAAFYDIKNRIVYETMLSMLNQQTAIDILTVCEALISKGKIKDVGGEVFISSLSTHFESTSAFAEHYAYIIRDLYIKRLIIIHHQELVSAITTDNGNVQEELTRVIDRLSKLSNIVTRTDNIHDVASEMHMVIDGIIKEAQNKKGLIVPTGIPTLDWWTHGGLLEGKVWWIVAGSSIGKSDAILNWMLSASKSTNVLFLSIEMSYKYVMLRMAAIMNDVDTYVLRSGNYKLDDAFYKNYPYNQSIKIIDRSEWSMPGIKSIISTQVARHSIKVVFIDYFLLIQKQDKLQPENAFREECARQFKIWAKEYDICIVVLNQLNKDKESKYGGKPDSDVMIYLDRENADADSAVDNMVYKVDKNRDGRRGKINILYHPPSGLQREVKDDNIDKPIQSKREILITNKEELPF